MHVSPEHIGPYRLHAELGQGEIGVVYRADDTLYERAVALKVLRPHVAEDLVLARHFINAGREAMRLRHPNIARVYDAGQADGWFYVASDLIEGEPLDARMLSNPGPWPASQAQFLLTQVAAGLEYAHRRGLVHHNLKPSNILVTPADQVLLVDFDAVPARGGDRGNPLLFRVKTPHYLAPEQARGDEGIDKAADLYALAALAYRLYTGVVPHAGGNPLSLIWRIAEETPKRADLLAPGLAPEVAEALALGLAKDPTQRFEHAGELVRVLAGDAVMPEPRARRKSAPRPAPIVSRDVPVDLPMPMPASRLPAAAPRPPSQTQVGSQPDDEVFPPAATMVEAPEVPAMAQPTLWERARRSARRAEPMALPALALLAVGGLAALLLIFAAMRVAGTLLARMADERMEQGEIIVVEGGILLPTVTPTRLGASDLARQVEEPMRAPENGGSQEVAAIPPVGNRAVAEFAEQSEPAVRMAVVVTNTNTPAPSATASTTPTPLPPTFTPTPAATWTPTTSPTPSHTPTPSATATPTFTPTPTHTPSPTVTPTPTRTPAPTAAGLSGHLAYTLWNPHTDRPDIWVWDLSARIHTTPIANRRQPDFSPTGGLVANAEGGGMDNLVQMGRYGESPWLISAHPEDAHPHWSPDGKMVAFDSAHMGDRQHRIYLQDDLARRDERRPMMFEAWELFGRYPVFLGDGRIAFNGCNYWLNGSICGVYVVDTVGGEPSNATGWPGDIPTDNLGSRVLMMSDRDGNWDIYSMAADGSDLRRLTDAPSIDGLATASPDGNNIAFLTDRDGVWSFYVMGVDGGNVRKLFDLPGNFGRGDYDWFTERISWGR